MLMWFQCGLRAGTTHEWCCCVVVQAVMRLALGPASVLDTLYMGLGLWCGALTCIVTTWGQPRCGIMYDICSRRMERMSGGCAVCVHWFDCEVLCMVCWPVTFQMKR